MKNKLFNFCFLFFVSCFATASGNQVLLEIGTAQGGANSQLSTAKSYTYNFGVTSSGSGVTLNQVILGVGRNNNITDGITFELYSGFGGAAGGNQLIASTTYAATTFIGTSVSAYTLNFPLVSLSQGAYSIRVTSNTASNSSYFFRDGLLRLGGEGIVSEGQWIQDSNTGGTAGTSIVPQSGYILADHAVSSGALDLGRFHANSAGPSSTTLTLSNVAPATSNNVTESLAASVGTVSSAAQISGLGESPIVQGGTNNLTLGLSGGTGTVTGTVELNFNSVQQGSASTRSGGPVSVGSRTISLSAFGYTGQSEWTADAEGSWNLGQFANWSEAGGTPGLDGAASVADTALFGGAATAARTISLNGSAPALRELAFDNANAGYTLAEGSGGSMVLGNSTHAAVLENRAGNHAVNVNIALGSDLDFTGAEGSTLDVGGVISGNGRSLRTLGDGQLRLNAANTYTGLTRISGGTLAIGANGSIASSSGIRIDNGASLDVTASEGFTIGAAQTLSGGGTVSGHVSISGTHTPGFSPGLQTFEDGLTYNSGSTFVWELIANTSEGRGTNFDAVDVTGGTLSIATGVTSELVFNFDGSTVNWTDSFWDADQSWLVFETAGSLSLASGSIFDILTVSTDSTGSLLNEVTGRNNAFFQWLEQDGDLYLQYVAIPEPSALVLALLLGTAAVLGLRRRRAHR